MTDRELAEEIANRLNKLIEEDKDKHYGVRELLETMCAFGIVVGPDLAMRHPTLQASISYFDGEYFKEQSTKASRWQIGLLGVLNGLCGIRPDAHGYICAEQRDGVEYPELVRFMMTPEPAEKANPNE